MKEPFQSDPPTLSFYDAVVATKVELPDQECMTPYFLVAYWRAGGWWKIHPKMYAEGEPQMQRDIARLQRNGWTHIHVMRLLL